MRKNLFGDVVDDRGNQLGCKVCPRNTVRGINKVKGLDRIKGRRAMLWAMCPGDRENEKRIELVGPSGNLLWIALKPLGLDRDSFDIQNVVRCRPRENQPTKTELHCCSMHNDEALKLNRGNAVVHLILGDVAGQQLLGKQFKKDQPVFWHAPWNAYVVLNHHPSYILRQGGTAAKGLYKDWSTRFRSVKAILDHPGRHGYVSSLDYALVRNEKEMDDLENKLRHEAAAGRRISVDLEWGTVDGKQVALVAGFGWGHYTSSRWNSWRGGARSVVLDHPQARVSPALKRRVVAVMEDPSIRKVLHHGCSDVNVARKLLGAKLGANLRGYDFDTYLGTYLRHSWMRAFSLESLAYKFLPEFADYKDCVDQWSGNFAEAPLDVLMLRNCGDCDATKRLETLISGDVPYELMQIYIHCSFTLATMEQRGPLLDWKTHEKIQKVIPQKLEKLTTQLRQVAEDPEFDPSRQIGWLLYDKLKLPAPEANEHGNLTTDAAYLELLATQTNSPVPQMVLDYRKLRTMESNFMATYARSAKMHGGELRTIWWLTGAVTGRLRSGASGTGEKGLVNLQNIHGSPLLKNMLVSDKNWRIALEAADSQ